MDAIVTENLCKTYPGKVALEGLNLAIRCNTIHGFLGPNGAGKSTTMNILSCLARQTSGKAYILGIDTLLDPLSVKERLGLLPEIPPLYGEMRVSDFLSFRANLYERSRDKCQRQVALVLEKMDLGEVANRLIDHLSKGLKQRVGIASALIFNPPVLILDEPAAGLDPKSIREIRRLILDLRKDHTVMLSSHHLGEVEQLCDEITIIKEGRPLLSNSFERMQMQFSRDRPLEIVVRGESRSLDNALEGIGPYQVSEEKDQMKRVTISLSNGDEIRPMICKRLVDNHLAVFEMRQVESSLEEIFLDLVEGGDRE